MDRSWCLPFAQKTGAADCVFRFRLTLDASILMCNASLVRWKMDCDWVEQQFLRQTEAKA